MHRIDPHVATLAPAELPERIEEHRDAILTFSIGLPVGSDQNADAWHSLALLRACRCSAGLRRGRNSRRLLVRSPRGPGPVLAAALRGRAASRAWGWGAARTSPAPA